jgi:hypothetical protein
VNELFIKGTVPSDEDNTKVGIWIDAATGGRWVDGCAGPRVLRGYLDLSKVEPNFPKWRRYTQNWIARARGGGAGTTFFYNGQWRPFGATYGARFIPSRVCTPPLPEPTPPPCNPLDPFCTPPPSPSPPAPPGKSPKP